MPDEPTQPTTPEIEEQEVTTPDPYQRPDKPPEPSAKVTFGGQPLEEESGEGQAVAPVSPDTKVPSGEEPPPDPLATITDIKALLSHPVLGPQFQSWADSSAQKAINKALNNARNEWSTDAQIEAWGARLDALSPEELGRALQDPETSRQYTALMERRNQQLDEESTGKVAQAAQVFGYAVQVKVNMDLLNSSDMPSEKKAELAPEHYQHLGGQGLAVWTSAIYKALSVHEGEKAAKSLLDERWEAYKEEQMGKAGGARRKNGTADISAARSSGPITRESLKNMTPQQILELPEDQVNAALAAPYK